MYIFKSTSLDILANQTSCHLLYTEDDESYSVPVWEIILYPSTDASTLLDAGHVHYQFTDDHEQKSIGGWLLNQPAR